MKLGIKREKIGDILVDQNGADIILCKEMLKFLQSHLSDLTRFQKAKIGEITLGKIRKVEIQKKEIILTVPSMRLDAIVSEIIPCSRKSANELIMQERVFINSEVITKCAKEIHMEDFITIRGKGKFQIREKIGNTRKGNLLVKVEKWI